MNISIIGIGKLGLCLALNFEASGYNVIGVDINEKYIESLNKKTFNSNEPSVNEFLLKSKNFKATNQIKEALQNEIIFITVATPSLESGKYDHSQINKLIDEFIGLGKQDSKKYLIINCTVMPGYCEKMQNRLAPYNYEVCYSPEFIAQGSIIHDQQFPDTILIGSSDEKALNLLESTLKSITKSEPKIHKMSLTEAEITKIALNCFLTTKIAYANMVGDIAIKTNCNPSKILSAIGDDSRIGNKYLKYGFGFGGPCFPRDNKAFGLFCEENGVYPHISYATDQSNKSHLIHQVENTLKLNQEEITIKSVTYKPNSFILEESQQLKYAFELTERGISVIIEENEFIVNKLKDLYGNRFKYIIK